MHELEAVQRRLYKSPPPNYGLLTSIIMHLMRNISFSVPPKTSYLTQALHDLNYESTINRFGMFFLHDLDITRRQLYHVMKEDNGDIDKAMNLHKKGRKRPARTTAAIIGPPPDLPNDSFPLGEAPTWSEVQDCLKHDPMLLIKPWEWNSIWDKDTDTSELFAQFTTDFWLALDRRVLAKPVPTTKTIKDAMELWSVAAIKQHLLDVSFIPNCHGISEKKKSSWSFSDLVSTFFPDPTLPPVLNSAWLSFHEHGYLKRYRELKNRITPRKFQLLTNNLKLLFSNIQCLPYSLLPQGNRKGRIWRSRQGTIEMLTNPKHYKLKSFGNVPKTTRKKAIRVNAHPAEVSARLGEVHSGIPTRVTKKSQRTAARLSRSRNKTNIQKRKNLRQEEEDDSTSSEQMESDQGSFLESESQED
jgi:hypothetical protein